MCRDTGQPRAAIRPRRAMIRHSARFLGVVRTAYACSLGSGCAPSAPNPVLDLVRCFIHCLEHCSQVFSKKN